MRLALVAALLLFAPAVHADERPVLPFSPAVVAGDLVFVSGQLPVDGQFRVIGTTIEEQTSATLDNVEAILRTQGLSLADVVKATVFLTRAEDFRAFNRAYVSRFKPPLPARTTVVAGMVLPGALIEIDVVARRSR